MRRILSSIFFILSFLLCNSQVLVDENHLWSNLEYGTEQPEHQHYHSYWIKFEGDSILHDTLYKKVWRSDDSLHTYWYSYGFIREDSSNRVYTREVPGLNYYASEELLYDFSLKAGDIFMTNSGLDMDIDSVGTIYLGNKKFRVIYSNIGLNWIEGIGSLSGIFNGMSNILLVGKYDYLVCFSENDTLFYHNEAYNNCFVQHDIVGENHLLTIGEVYDFQLGDEFQYKTIPDGPPNADRIKVIGKEYSTDSSSITYSYFHDTYSSSVSNQSLIYSFDQFTSQQTISGLDSSIESSIHLDPANRNLTIYYDSLCYAHVNGFYIVDSRAFESNSDRYEYGKGLGLVKYEYGSEGPWGKRMFFYEKHGLSCGARDLTTNIGKFKSLSGMNVFPNPFRNSLTIERKSGITADCDILKLTGEKIHNESISGILNTINLPGLDAGVYILRITNGRDLYHIKIIKQ